MSYIILAVVPEQSEDATKGLRVINFIVPCVLKSNFLGHIHVLVPVAAAVTTKHQENVAVISSNNSLLYLMHTGSQCFTHGHASCLFHLISRDLLRKQEKTRNLREIEPLLIANHISVFWLSMA